MFEVNLIGGLNNDVKVGVCVGFKMSGMINSSWPGLAWFPRRGVLFYSQRFKQDG